jgi:hypothetical protein
MKDNLKKMDLKQKKKGCRPPHTLAPEKILWCQLGAHRRVKRPTLINKPNQH